MPISPTELHLYATLALARMEIERIHYIEAKSGQTDLQLGYADCLATLQVCLFAIIRNVSH